MMQKVIRTLSLLPVASLVACQPVQMGGAAPDPLAQEIAGRVAAPAESCAPIQSQSAMRIVDRRTVAVDAGRTLWINRLPEGCPGLRPSSTVIVEAHGSRYCRGDLIRAVEPGLMIPGPACPLQNWTPYRRR